MPTSIIIEKVASLPPLSQLQAQHPEKFPYLLESVVSGGNQARWSILFAYPQAQIEIDPTHLSNSNQRPSFITQFNNHFSAESTPSQTQSPIPFYGGWFVFLSYEFVQEIEPILTLPQSNTATPYAFATRIPAAILWDHQQKQGWLVTERSYPSIIKSLLTDIKNYAKKKCPTVKTALEIDHIKEDNPEHYLNSVNKIKQYIVEGDVFQVNLSRKWRAHIDPSIHPVQLYEALSQNNPAPFAGMVYHNQYQIISSSPERLIKVNNHIIETRPIAGTRPRDPNPVIDQRLLAELIAHPKERAEHIMLIDLERNDLGRICQPGSIKVEELMSLESYSFVHHIVSNVTGKIRPDILPGDIFKAVFPGGTITGCPKVRCMEIIAELEQESRGAYTGSMGYINHDGSMDLNILIRTLEKQGDQLIFRAGAGIVADSIPEKELEETRAKAKGLLKALQ